MTDQTIQEGKTMALVSYITIIGVFIAFFSNKDIRNPFTAFHTRQALGLWLLEMVLGFAISGFDNWTITYSFWLFFGILFFYGIFNAFIGKAQTIPLLGDFFQRIFSSIGK
jgi:uncharacterized membrane protein